MGVHLVKCEKLRDFVDREEEHFIKIYEDSSSTLLFMVDLDGIIIKIIGGQTRFNEMEVSDMIGRKYSNFLDGKDVETAKEYYKNMHNGIMDYAKFKLTNNDDLILMPIEIGENEIIGFYGLAHCGAVDDIRCENCKFLKNVDLG